MAKTFKNVEELITYYRFKTTTATEVKFEIDGTVRTFGGSRGTPRNISKRQHDTHRLRDYETKYTSTPLDLVINFVRYFDDKRIVEAYFVMESEGYEKWISPIFFDHNEEEAYFVRNSDFDEYDTGLENETKAFLGRKWFNTYVHPDAFATNRNHAYKGVAKTQFYETPGAFGGKIFIPYDPNISTNSYRTYRIIRAWKQKWSISENGNCPYFQKVIEPPEYW